MQAPVALLSDPRQVGALTDPLRVRILDALRTPDTAAELARALGRSRQSMSYHVKELERVGLVRRTGERRKGNFVEQLYQATARRFVVSPRFAQDPERMAELFRDQVSLARLVELGERLQGDAAGLIDLASSEDAPIPSVSVEAEVRFADETAREAFMREYVAALEALLAKHGRREGRPFRVAMAAYPQLGAERGAPGLEEER